MSIGKRSGTTGERIVASVEPDGKGTVRVSFQDGGEGTISATAYLSAFLYPGKKVSSEEWRQLSQISGQAEERRYVERLLSRKLYSPRQIVEKLKRVRKLGETESEKLVATLRKEGLIDPLAYVENRADSLRAKGFSPAYIRRALTSEGLEDEIVEKVRKIYENVDDQSLFRLLDAAVRRCAGEAYRKTGEKAVSCLVKKGYSFQEAESIFARYSLHHPSLSSDERERGALLRAAKSVYGRIATQKKAPFQKALAFRRALVAKGFSKEDVEQLVEKEDYRFD